MYWVYPWCFQYAQKLMSKKGKRIEVKKMHLYYRSFRCRCNGMDFNSRKWYTSVVAFRGNGTDPFQHILQFFKVVLSTSRIGSMVLEERKEDSLSTYCMWESTNEHWKESMIVGFFFLFFFLTKWLWSNKRWRD